MEKKNFVQDEPVIMRRIGDGKEYRAKVVGKSVEGATDFYIVELLDPIPGNSWTHIAITEACLDKSTTQLAYD